jgi:protein-histidine pros-kinase
VPQTSFDKQNTNVRRGPLLPAGVFLLLVGAAISVSAFIGVPTITIASHVGVAALAIGIATLVWVIAKPRHLTPALPAVRENLNESGASDERLTLACTASNLEMWEYDFATRQLVWSANRRPATEMFERHANADDRAVAEATVKDAIRTGQETCNYEYRITKEGVTRHLRDCVAIVRNSEGAAERLVGTTKDVTAEIEAIAALQQRAKDERIMRDRLSVATAAAGIEVWEFDLRSAQFTWIVNKIPAYGLHDVPIEHYADAWNALLPPEDQLVIQQSVERAIRSNQADCAYRFRVNCTDRVHHMQAYVRIERDASGRPQCLRGTTRDISDEVETTALITKQAEQERVLRDRLNVATRSAGIASWEIDLKDVKFLWRENWHLFAEETGEMALKLIQDRVLPEDRNNFRNAVNAAIAAGVDTFAYRYQLRHSDGKILHLQHHARLLLDAAGQPSSALGVSWEITKEVEAANALELAQQRFARAINGTQDGLWEIEANGSAWISPRVIELLGYRQGDLPETTDFLREFLHPEDIERVAATAKAHDLHDEPYDVEIRLRLHSGEYRWFRARAKAERDPAGCAVRLSGSLQDVSDAHAAREEVLRAKAAAENANEAKGAFLANVSHEIRTPMNGIIGLSNLLLETALDRTQHDYAKLIYSSSEALLTVINDILDFSKIEAGKLAIETIEFDVRASVEDVGAMLAGQAAAKKLELIVDVQPDMPLHALGDPQRIRQCLINLVGNAIKFTQSGEVRLGVRTVKSSDERTWFEFDVRDSGIGIDAATQSTLFQPFVQADSSTTRIFGGTGLGLSIVRRLVEMLGGTLGVDSERGVGSRFWFRLPLKVIAGAAAPTLDLGRVGRRILVAVPNASTREVLIATLAHAGYDAAGASSAATALDQIHRAHTGDQPYECVIVDRELADVNGLISAAKLQSKGSPGTIAPILLSAADAGNDISHAASAGFVGSLTKPVRARELLGCLDRALGSDVSALHPSVQPSSKGSLAGPKFAARALVVEDNVVNQKVASRFLERLGCEVRIANNGADGVAAYQDGAFDILFMDLQMPVMDGITATQRIRALEVAGGKRTPIIALTANAMVGQLERCLASDMDGFLTKPLQSARLQEVLDRFCKQTEPARGNETASSSSGPAPIDMLGP